LTVKSRRLAFQREGRGMCIQPPYLVWGAFPI